ncbi:MAG: hypothetical protein ACOX3R_00665 [Desulfitobacteriia bacterium]
MVRLASKVSLIFGVIILGGMVEENSFMVEENRFKEAILRKKMVKIVE